MQIDGSAAPQRPHPLRLHLDRFPGEPLLDTAISHAMLRRVAAGSVGESLRLYTPDRAVLFSSLDARRPGYARALSLAEEAGIPSVIRLAGGQAALFLEQSIAFAWATPDPDARLHIRPRFESVARWITAALRRLGLDARIGAVAGEYCPGEFSINIGGRVKVMGVGQRVIQGGAHVGGVITIAQTSLLRETLVPIYEALELDFRPETAGGIADFDASLGPSEVVAAMLEALGELAYNVEPQGFDASIRGEAELLLPIHEPNADKERGRVLRAHPGGPKALIQGDARNSTADPSGSDDS